MIAKDFLLDEFGDLDVSDGDFVTGESDGQHIQDIFELEPGELKESPLTGIGIQKKINGAADGELRAYALLQLEADGYEVNMLSIIDEIIKVDAERKG